MILKPNMVEPSRECPAPASPQQVAQATLICLRRTVLAAVHGINFLSGVQSETIATANLHALNTTTEKQPWVLSFSYGRALQASVLRAWRGKTGEDLQQLFADIDLLRLQEAEKQNDFKLSYYAPADIEPDDLLKQMRQRLDAQDIRASLIWSIDEATDTGLLDVLPEHATKLHAIEFLMNHKGFAHEKTDMTLAKILELEPLTGFANIGGMRAFRSGAATASSAGNHG